MIFGKKYVFLELGRTGSTYARYILVQIPNSYGVGKKHNNYNSLNISKKKEFEQKYKIGTIRNPFEFYVSLFVFCCEKRGGLYDRITKKPDIFSYYNYSDIFKTIYLHFKYKKKWLRVLDNRNSNENFKHFIKLLFDINPEAMGNHYGLSKLNNSIGLLTFNYLKLYSKNFINESKTLKSYKEIVEYDKKNNFMDCVFRNESLAQDILDNYKFYADSEDTIKKAILNRPKRSKTSTVKKPFHLFYDDELKEIIFKKDQFIFEKYGYCFEDLLKK